MQDIVTTCISDCFDYARMVNDTVEYKLNNDTVNFFTKANETLACFHNTSNVS